MKGSILNWGLKGATALCLSVAMVSPALADSPPFGDGGVALQGVLDDITVVTLANPTGDSSVDVTTDALSDDLDSYWAIGGSGASVSTIIIELAGFANQNVFGVYDRNDATNTVQLFNGLAGQGDQVAVGIAADGSVLINFADTGVDFGSGNNFGFYLDSSANAGGGFWYSDSNLNIDQGDHMGAYQGVGDTIQIPGLAAGIWGSNEYVLAFEDLHFAGSDRDFTDFVVLVESVNPVPEPSTMMLLGSSLLGLAAWKRRKAS